MLNFYVKISKANQLLNNQILPIQFKYLNDSNNCSNPLARTAGMLSKKENLAAESLFNPENNPPVIVVPERDAPGIKANACAIPIKIESLIEISFTY